MTELWYYTSEGKQMDPVSMHELTRLVADGVLKPTDMVWTEGMPRWIRASSVKELFPDPIASLEHHFTHTSGASDWREADGHKGSTGESAPANIAGAAAKVEAATKPGPTDDALQPRRERAPHRRR